MKKHLRTLISIMALGIFSLSTIGSSAYPYLFSTYATDFNFSVLEFDVSGELSYDNQLTSSPVTISLSVSGEDASKVQSATLSDGQSVDFSQDSDKVEFTVKNNGEYSAKLVLLGGEEVDIEQTVTVNCIDRAAPVVKSAEYADELISKGNVYIKAYVSEYVTKGCDKSFGKITGVYLLDADSGNKVSETNIYKDGCYTLEASKNGSYLVYAEDMAGNVSEPYKVKVDVFDKDAPVIKVVSTDYFERDPSLFEIIFTVEDDSEITDISIKEKGSETSLEYKKNKKDYSCTVSKNGTYIITATDKAGNKSELKTKVDLKDKVPPVIAFENTDSELFGKDTVKISFTITDPNGFSLIYINGNSVDDFDEEDTEYSGKYELAVNETLEVLAYDTDGNMTYDSVKNAGGDAQLPIITSLEVSDVTDTSAKAAVTLENPDGMTFEWYILEPNGKWSKLAGENAAIDIYGLKRHSDYTVRVEVINSDGATDTETASFTTLSMGTIRESDDSWMMFVVIGIISCVVIAMTIFIIILIKNKKRS